MPGLNKKGPQNMGPLTGRKLGTCTRESNETEEKQAFGRGLGNGGRRAGIGKCGGRGMRRGLNAADGGGRGRGMRRQFR